MFRFACLRLLPLEKASIRGSATHVDVDQCAVEVCRLVDRAAGHLRAASGKIRGFETKLNSKDLVTATDREIEELLIKGLRGRFPEHVYIGEEGTAGASTGRKLTEEPTWIVDPIDGTTNFVHGFHCSCISVGFWLNKQPELAICHNPTLELIFTARRNRGAYLNGESIRTSGQTELERSLIMQELNAENLERCEHRDILLANAVGMLLKAHALRTTGSAVMDMCLVAMGAADGYYEFYPHAWDLAAGALLVREAGGVVMDPAGGEFDIMSRRVLAAATPELGSQMVRLLGDRQIYHHRDDEPPGNPTPNSSRIRCV
ncbi:inositol monophosphatase 1-like [Drosophila novamexicana]|uniref:inositol monophosphatase 1-like n=1 Tax=Drosophila novamexicana TaxID=47314 RepID=UPI0011E5FF6E|nr:inositol monophosphatase 1-like [Drosophila novamexicana]